MPSSSPKSTRDIENFTLNVVLYISSLLLMTSAALFANTLAPAPVKIGLLLLATALFYLAGLWTYYKLAKLRLASYFFCATAIALLPINGFVAYNLAWHNGPALWLCTSLLGTLLLAFTCLIMPARILGYLFISFLVSDVLSSSKLLQLSILYTHRRSSPKVVYRNTVMDTDYDDMQRLERETHSPGERRIMVYKQFAGTYWEYFDYENKH